eukprot:352421-Chlamydomonas_euryale.AAC.5
MTEAAGRAKFCPAGLENSCPCHHAMHSRCPAIHVPQAANGGARCHARASPGQPRYPTAA